MKLKFEFLSLALGLGLALASCGGGSTEQTGSANADEEVASAAAGVYNPNLASREELTSIPHIDASKAAVIEAARPFLDPQDFLALIQREFSAEQMEEILPSLFLPMNLNTTPEKDFLSVPGVGEKMAHEFEEYRPYTSVAQFRREIGKYVDEQQVATYEQYVFVPVNLNSASKEEILAIPGMGDRMLHEFEEYRPYESMEQFRREIGKYVDDDELARLERYVTL